MPTDASLDRTARPAAATGRTMFGTQTAVLRCVQPQLSPRPDREAISRALIDIVADVAWAEREHRGARASRLQRDEAMSLLAKVELGDHEARERAVELVNAVRRSAGS